MDIGFEQAGFKTTWANEYDKAIAPSYKKYFKDTVLDTRSIREIKNEEIPKKNIQGVIGGPPCQSWSQAGSRRGIEDPRGQLFYEYLRIIEHVSPKFFVAENVAGLIHKRNLNTFNNIINLFEEIGYKLTWKLVNSSDYEVPQDRKRVIIVGYKKNLNKTFEFPKSIESKKTMQDAIGNLSNLTLGSSKGIKNHELIESGFSSIFLSRNRVRGWNQQSYTILASDRHIPFHPSAPKMIKVGKDKMELAKDKTHLYRRLTVRECARIQTFPDQYEFLYKNIRAGYKMIGNAVPIKLAYHIAKKIKDDLEPRKKASNTTL